MAESEPAENITSGFGLLGSEAVFEFVCQPCGYEGSNVEACGYCMDCSEYLCAVCYAYYSKVAITRHHKLTDKENMLEQPSGVIVKDICTERCRSHKAEIVKYFCPTHEDLGCSVCVTIKHTSCEIKYIADICKDLEDSEEYKAFQTRMQDLILKYENSIESDTRALEELQALLKGFDALIDQKRYCRMFTDMKYAEQNFLGYKDETDCLRNCVSEFIFYDKGELQSVKRNEEISWRVVERTANYINLTHDTDIYIKLHNDSDTWSISGIAVMSKETFIVADNENKKFKLCVTTNNKVTSELETEEEPWDVTRVSENLAAVTLPDAQKVIFLKCDKNKIVIDREIEVNGQCYGVDCADEKLFVSYEDPCKVEILSLTGEVLQSFVNNDQGQKLFKEPRYVLVNTNNESIYVSDYEEDSVIQIDMKGNVKREYEKEDMIGPNKMTVGAFSLIYLCGGHSSEIHLLTPECKKVDILLNEDDNKIYCPRCIDYCEATDRLYIGMEDENTIEVYQVEHLAVYKMIRSHNNGN